MRDFIFYLVGFCSGVITLGVFGLLNNPYDPDEEWKGKSAPTRQKEKGA